MEHRDARRRLFGVLSIVLVAACAVKPSDVDRAKARIRFADMTDEVGLPTAPTRTFGALTADHDDDGDLDLFINRHADVPSLYALQEGRFVPTISTFMRQEGYVDADDRVDRHGCAWGEANGDGRIDLFCTQGAQKGTGTGPNQLFLGADGRFIEVAKSYGVDDPFGRGRSANWLDHDLDGDLDLFVINAVRSGYPSVTFRNERGSFTAVDLGIAASTSGWPTSSTADWDLDGDPDLLVLDGDRGVIAYRNDRTRFVKTRLPSVPVASWSAASWVDIDGDVRLDLHLVSKKRSLLIRNTAAGSVPVHDVRLRSGRMAAWFDVENDGDLDMMLVQGATGSSPRRGPTNAPDLFYENRSGSLRRVRVPSIRGPSRGNGDAAVTGDYDADGRTDVFVANGHNPWVWTGSGRLLRNVSGAWAPIALDLVGTRWNPSAYGAHVTVQTSATTYRRYITDGVSYRAQSGPSDLLLGIGNSDRAVIVVRWPDGSRTCATATAGTRLVMRIGSEPCRLP